MAGGARRSLPRRHGDRRSAAGQLRESEPAHAAHAADAHAIFVVHAVAAVAERPPLAALAKRKAIAAVAELEAVSSFAKPVPALAKLVAAFP